MSKPDPMALSAADSTLAKILAYNSSSALANSSAANDPAETSQSGEGIEHVLAVDELWNKDKSVCLVVKELKDGVVFEVCSTSWFRSTLIALCQQVSNIGTKSAMVSVQCAGENLHPLTVSTDEHVPGSNCWCRQSPWFLEDQNVKE